MENNNSKAVADFYDEFKTSQAKTGTNLRHYFLINQLRKAGLRNDSKVLEIGCGIGIFTSLICMTAKRGRVVATDISGESVALANMRCSFHKNSEFFTTDMSDFLLDEKFDFIVLADVLEHIPFEAYSNLFEKISGMMHSGSIMFASIPSPPQIEFLKKFQPDKLQIIDQAVHTDILCNAIYPAGLVVTKQEPVTIFHEDPDYTIFLMRLKPVYQAVKEYSQLRIIFAKQINRLRFRLSLLIRI